MYTWASSSKLLRHHYERELFEDRGRLLEINADLLAALEDVQQTLLPDAMGGRLASVVSAAITKAKGA
tara:strand:- start:353 stop:556 length:204 start_codon:yes stop_codon:yes gene_type:complete